MIDDDPGGEMCRFLEVFAAMCQLAPGLALEGLLLWAVRIQAVAAHARNIESESEWKARREHDHGATPGL